MKLGEHPSPSKYINLYTVSIGFCDHPPSEWLRSLKRESGNSDQVVIKASLIFWGKASIILSYNIVSVVFGNSPLDSSYELFTTLGTPVSFIDQELQDGPEPFNRTNLWGIWKVLVL